MLTCRAENLQLQSSLADAQDEAQLLRRLLTLCNQALEDAERTTEDPHRVAEAPQPQPEHEQAGAHSVRAHDFEQDEVIVHYNAAVGYYRWPWFDQLQVSARSTQISWQL